MTRAVRLLRAIAASRDPLDLAALSERCDLTRSTAHRLLSALHSEGLVTRDSNAAYRVGPLAMALGDRARASYDLLRTARPTLEALARDSGETATLEISDNGKMLIVDEVAGRHLMGSAPELGTSWALHATSSGKAVLAALEGPERAALLRGRLRRFTAATVTARTELEAQLAGVSRDGFSLAVDELEQGFSAVSAAVRDAMMAPVAAISINAPTVRLQGKARIRAGKLVRQAAADISRALGAPAA